MSSSVTMKALHSGCAVLSQTPGFFSTAADSCPVMGAALVWRALAIADRRVLSVQPGPTPAGAAETSSNTFQQASQLRLPYCDFKSYQNATRVNATLLYLAGLLGAPLFLPALLRCHKH